ncbi:MAG: prepilin peptidase [Pseudomonadota bacterium]
MVEAIHQELPYFFPITFFAFGLLFGSFANVVILRMPAGESFVAPRSRCPKCGHLIRFYENIPVISWLFLRGKCSNCKTPISPRYPFVEMLMGLLFTALYLKVGLSWTLLEYIVFGFSLVVVSFIDLDHMILPDKFTLSGIVIGLLGAVLNPERDVWDAFFGVLFGGGFLYAIAFIYFAIRKRDGMGGGDIKLLGWIGAILGWKAMPFVILMSSVVGAFVGVSVSLKNKAGLKSSIPFGPYLASAALIYILFGEEIGAWYIQAFIPSIGQ